MNKICLKCKINKSIDYYHKDSSRKDGLACYCKECKRKDIKEYRNKNILLIREKDRNRYILRKEWKKQYDKKYSFLHQREKRIIRKRHSLRIRYNLTLEAYDELIKNQKGECGICKRKIKLEIDHDHKTGLVRGLICHRCNLLLGYAVDDINILNHAIFYLLKDKK